ncbi:hypothetical protein GCM10009747_32210 [Agromyces humatus]|uniref:DUF4352 domain-containing protein n=1 Tax=Agromyces humatus TaxID=279573 RepID=A0ABN2KXF2_9MICO
MFAFIPFVGVLAGFVAFVGVVLGVIALFLKGKAKGVAAAGAIVSAAALVLSIVMSIAYTAAFVTSVDEAIGGDTTAVDAANDAPADVDVEEPSDEPAPAPEPGTRENPAAIGTTVVIGPASAPDWQLTVGAPTLDANAIVAAENQFNEPAPEGMQWAMVPVTVTYVGTTTGTPWIDLSVKFVSADGTTHEEYDHSAVIPNDWSEINELYPDASATGNVAIAVPSADIANGAWVVSASLLGEDYFFKAS